MARSHCYPSQMMMLKLAWVASFFIQSSLGLVPWGLYASKKPSFFQTEKQAVSNTLLSLSSDPHPPENPPSKRVLESATYFASPDSGSVGDLDDNVEAQTSVPLPSYTPGDKSRFEVSEELLELGNKAVEHVFKPMVDLQKGVSTERIKGAAITGAVLGLLVGNGIVAAGAAGLGAAYLAISKGVTGDVLRTVGGIAWDVTDTTVRLLDQLSNDERFNGIAKDLTEKAILAFQSTQDSAQYLENKRSNTTSDASDVIEAEQALLESQEELARVLKEAEAVIDAADKAIAEAQAEQKVDEKGLQLSKTEGEEKLRAQQELFRHEEKQLTREKKGFEKESPAEMERQEDAPRGEDVSMAEIDTMKDDLHADEGRLADIAIPAEEEEGLVLDEDEWIAAAEIAHEGLEGKIVGVEEMIADNSAKAEWDAAGILARELEQDSQASGDDDFESLDFDALGKAAREAVESFESEMKDIDASKLDQKRKWANSMAAENIEGEMGIGGSDISFEDVAPAARQAVDITDEEEVKVSGFYEDKNDMDREDTDVTLNMKDWASMTVAQLRDELKVRGLKTNGKKAELIEILEKSDAELFNRGIVNGNDDNLASETELDADFADFDIEELGRQARAAVQLFQNQDREIDEEPTEEMLALLESEMASDSEFIEEPTTDFAQMTVDQLKDECRSRGLKVGGKKSDLIKRLQSSFD